MKRSLQVLFILALAAAALGACGPGSPLSVMFSPVERIQVYVPDGFEGNILIAWEVPDGTVAEEKEGVWQYRLQEDGALLLQNEPPQGRRQWYFAYEKDDGSLTPIPNSTCFESATETGIVVCGGTTAGIHDMRELRPNMQYTITTVEDRLLGKWSGDEFFRLTDRYLDQLALPDEGRP